MRKILPILNVIQRVSARFSGGDVVVRSHGAWWAILAGSPGVLRGGVGAVVLVVRRPGGGVGSAVPPRPASRRGGRRARFWRPGRIVPSPAPHRPHKNRGIMRKPLSASGAPARTILPKHQNRAREPADAPPAAEDTPRGDAPTSTEDRRENPDPDPGRPSKTAPRITFLAADA